MRGDLGGRVGLFLALIALAAVTGCGGESKNDVISEGDEICREANDELEQLEEPETVSGLPAYAREARPIFDGAVEDLKDLDPPGEDKGSFNEFIEKSEELGGVLDELAAAGPGTSDAELQEMSDRIAEITDEANAAAEEYGFDDCAE